MDALAADQGVMIIWRGTTLRIILPSDNFFYPASDELIPERIPVLKKVAALVNCECYGELPITVTGYTDNLNTIPSQYERAYEQAHKIAALLWSNDIPWSRMQIITRGPRGTIASNETPRGSAFNRRVEITVP